MSSVRCFYFALELFDFDQEDTSKLELPILFLLFPMNKIAKNEGILVVSSFELDIL